MTWVHDKDILLHHLKYVLQQSFALLHKILTLEK